jgi:hypothetical protein
LQTLKSEIKGGSMKKTSLIIASVAILAGVVAAMPSQAYACYCEARSSYAWGWGRSSACSVARKRALAECAVRTPRGAWCYITFCR